jgi:DUF1680 family protein
MTADAQPFTMTRRQLLEVVGSALVANRLLRAAAAPALSPVPLGDVRLLEGPFLDAQKRDLDYLLLLKPDRLLHNFRVNAGLEPKGPVYGGWESEEPWVGIRCQGHTLGHYLSAAAMMYASTGDERLRQRVDYIVAELRACQQASRITKNGLLCAFPDGSTQLDNAVAGRRFIGVPWYTMHKIFAGLRDAHLYGGSTSALDVLTRLADWAATATAPMSDEQFQHMLDTEHGGMNEVLADVSALTGDSRYLNLARRFCHQAVLAPLADSRDALDGLHANTQIPKVVGFQRLYELTGEDRYRRAARFFWQTVTGERSFVTGGHGDNEHFFPSSDFVKHLESAKTMETCCTHNMLRLTRMLFADAPSAALADFYERALFNGILASQDPESGMNTYFQATRPGYVRLFHTPERSFWCCTGTGIENHAKYGDSIYFHDSDALWVNLFVPSVVTWKDKGVTLRQTTAFPEEEGTRLAVSVQRPVRATIRVRQPGWCSGMRVRVNGRAWPVSAVSNGYVPIARQWRNGDVVDVQLPMALGAEPLPGTPGIVAFVYGPIVLAGRLGREGLAPGNQIIVNERESGRMLNAAIAVPALAGSEAAVLRRISRDRRNPLTFHTTGVGSTPVELAPYYRLAHERYNLYWTLAETAGRGSGERPVTRRDRRPL